MDHQYKLLRTLSDSGDVSDALLARLLAEASDVVVEDARQEGGASVNHDQRTLRVSTPDSDYSKSDSGSDVVGEEDEGFDEEFCDTEELLRNVPEPQTAPIPLRDLNDPDLQTFLSERSSPLESLSVPFPTATLFDDVDPGVYMLEAESSTHSLLDPEPLKSPMQSPYAVQAASPVCANMRLMSLSDTVEQPALSQEGDWVLCGSYQEMFEAMGAFEDSEARFLDHSSPHHTPGFPDYSSCSVERPQHSPSPFTSSSHSNPNFFPPAHSHTPSPPPVAMGSDYDLNMLVSSVCNSAASTATHAYSSATLPAGNTSATSHLTTASEHSSRHQDTASTSGSHSNAADSKFTCNLTLQMELNFATGQPPVSLADQSNKERCSLPSPAPIASGYGGSFAPVTIAPSSNCGYNPASNGVVNSTSEYVGCVSSNGLHSSPAGHGHGMDTSSSSYSCSTQTPLSPVPNMASGHSPVSVFSECSTTVSAASSCVDPDLPKSKNQPGSVNGIISMPFYQFKRILDSSVVPEQEKSSIKSIRRRGKNKIAAKHCRQRKLELVMGLQQEVEHLKDVKKQISHRTHQLQREIVQLKARCSTLAKARVTREVPRCSHS